MEEKRNALQVAHLMLIALTGHLMENGLHLLLIERVNLLEKCRRNRKSPKKLNHKSGLFQQMAVKHDNSRLCNMELQILSGRQLSNSKYILRKLDLRKK